MTGIHAASLPGARGHNLNRLFYAVRIETQRTGAWCGVAVALEKAY